MRKNSKIGVSIGLSMVLIGILILIIGGSLGIPIFLTGVVFIVLAPSVIMMSFQKEMRKWSMKKSAEIMKEMMEDPEMKEMITNNPMMKVVSQMQVDNSKPEPKVGNKICTKCGKEIPEDSKFCKECGTSV